MVAMGDEISLSVRSLVDDAVDDFDRTEGPAEILAEELVVIAGDVDDA